MSLLLAPLPASAQASPSATPPQNAQTPSRTSPDSASPDSQSLGPQAIIDDKLAKLANSTDKTEALRLADDILASWRDSGGPIIDLLVRRGIKFAAHNQFDLARDMFDRVVLIQPDFAQGWYLRAGIFMRKDQYAQTAADLEATIALEPRHFAAWQNLGQMFERLNEHEAALNAYRQALRLHPFLAQAKAGQKRLLPLIEGRAL